MEERLVELNSGQEKLKANVALLIEEHKKGMKVVIDYFKTLFSGLAMQGPAFGPIRTLKWTRYIDT